MRAKISSGEAPDQQYEPSTSVKVVGILLQPSRITNMWSWDRVPGGRTSGSSTRHRLSQRPFARGWRWQWIGPQLAGSRSTSTVDRRCSPAMGLLCGPLFSYCVVTADSKLTWTTPSEELDIGLNLPASSTEEGKYYPRAGTSGRCASHSALITIFPHENYTFVIGSITGDDSWLQ